MARNQANQMIVEMQEFASFSAAEQRYIRRSLDVSVRGIDAKTRWARSLAETASIKAQDRLYRTLLILIRNSVPDDIGIDATAEIIGPLNHDVRVRSGRRQNRTIRGLSLPLRATD